jgi:hypothetical protein
VVGEQLLAEWLRRSGVGVVGDQPAYLTQAQALLRGTVHTYAVYKRDLAHHYFSAFPPGTKISSAVFESFRGPRGVVSPFEPGISAILAPFLAVAGQTGAFVGFFAVEIAGLVLVHRRVSSLCGLGWRAQVVLGVAFTAPAVAIGATQIYPDLISGIVLAAALVELARCETSKQLDRSSAVIIAVCAAALPWLQIKDVVPAAVVVACWVVVAWCARPPRPRVLVIVVGGVAASWVLLGVYNLLYFGHLSGYPEPPLAWNHAAVDRMMALLFDRDQGLFVQLPAAWLGVIGLFAAVRRAPAVSAAAVAGIAAVLVLNGAYGSNPFGGDTLAGRFEWTAMPVTVAFGAFALERWQAQHRALLRGAAVLFVCWCYQARSLVAHAHTDLYFTQLTGWDPATYPGWWSAVDRLLPDYLTSPGVVGTPRIGDAVVMLLGLAMVWIPGVPRLRRRDDKSVLRWGPAVSAGALVGLSVVAVAIDPGPGLPPTPLTYAGTSVGSPLVAGRTAADGPEVPLQGTAPGTYRLTVSYHLTGRESARLVVSCDATPTGGTHLRDQVAALDPGSHATVATITCTTSGSVAATLRTPPKSILDVGQVILAKTGAPAVF